MSLAWSQLEKASRGEALNPVDRQLKAAVATDKPGVSRLIEEQYINGELRKAALRWSVYRFSVKFEPTAN